MLKSPQCAFVHRQYVPQSPVRGVVVAEVARRSGRVAAHRRGAIRTRRAKKAVREREGPGRQRLVRGDARGAGSPSEATAQVACVPLCCALCPRDACEKGTEIPSACIVRQTASMHAAVQVGGGRGARWGGGVRRYAAMLKVCHARAKAVWEGAAVVGVAWCGRGSGGGGGSGGQGARVAASRPMRARASLRLFAPAVVHA